MSNRSSLTNAERHTVAEYRDPYGYGAVIKRMTYGQFRLRIFTNGKTTFRRDYKSWAGARRTLNRFSDVWYEEKK